MEKPYYVYSTIHRVRLSLITMQIGTTIRINCQTIPMPTLKALRVKFVFWRIFGFFSMSFLKTGRQYPQGRAVG